MPPINPFSQLSPELVRCIASYMHPNYVATDFKLTCTAVAEALRGEDYRRIQLRDEPQRMGCQLVESAAQPWPGAAFVAHWGRPEPWRALARWQRLRLLCLAASSHHPPSLDAALAYCGTVIEADALASAIIAGDLETCRRFFETEGCNWDEELDVVAAEDWPDVFAGAAANGDDLPLLRHLHKQLGVAIDLAAVAEGCSEEALSWAVAALEAAGQAPEPLSCTEFKEVLSKGNLAAADWLVRHGLAPPKQELLEDMLLDDYFSTDIPNLQWVVEKRGGQDRVQSQPQVRWSAELYAGLVRMREVCTPGRCYAVPAHTRWLAALVDVVAAEALGGRASAPDGV
ncbi:hypothetical protein HXX76_012863 [Chlamydomonas incerta]|uniref:Uncharacterized protein n=1 Tax=Chlamydomonas incerta TaxID=51695 RepID=A0A835SU47_CHLIN|nr:hypothetical protein HXX76_012863 [Chlamydomonas incerta]|eukprot:KAG2426810.1 hypothetical protein HXX76_012863 [Chlamydomonas incerta]